MPSLWVGRSSFRVFRMQKKVNVWSHDIPRFVSRPILRACLTAIPVCWLTFLVLSSLLLFVFERHTSWCIV